MAGLLIIVKHTFIYCGLFVFSYFVCFGTAFDFDLWSFRLFLTKNDEQIATWEPIFCKSPNTWVERKMKQQKTQPFIFSSIGTSLSTLHVVIRNSVETPHKFIQRYRAAFECPFSSN